MRQFHLALVSLAISAVILLYCVFAPSALPRWVQMNQRVRVLHTQIETLEQENSELGQQIELLAGESKRSIEYLKRLVRNELGLIGHDEHLVLMDSSTDE